MTPLVCYSHTDYIDILTVQNAFLQSTPGTKVLMINKLPSIPTCFDAIVLYDDSQHYSKRVLQGLQQLDAEFVLFYHDMDVLIRYSPHEIEDLTYFMRTSNIDRIDLQYSAKQEKDSIQWKDVTLTRSDSFIYNVNPSIWRRSALMDIMRQFNKSYRQIEDMETQAYCQRFNIFKVWSPQKVHAGYFHTPPFFVFLHLTHGGKLLPAQNNNLEPWIQVIYRGILASFSFRREIRRTLH